MVVSCDHSLSLECGNIYKYLVVYFLSFHYCEIVSLCSDHKLYVGLNFLLVHAAKIAFDHLNMI